MSRYSPGGLSVAAKIKGTGPGTWLGPSGERSGQVPFIRLNAPNSSTGGVFETIWPGTGDLAYRDTAVDMPLITAAGDDGKTIEVGYLTTDFVPQPPVTLICNNATPPVVPNFLRLLRMRVTKDLGTRLVADADLELGGLTYGRIAAGGSINQIAAFSFPANTFGAVCFLYFDVPDGKAVSVRLQKREVLAIGLDAAWEDLEELDDMAPGPHFVPFCMNAFEAWSGVKVDPGTDIRVQCLAGGNNQSISGHLAVISQPIPTR